MLLRFGPQRETGKVEDRFGPARVRARFEEARRMAETDPLRALTLYSDLLGREPSNFEAHMRMATLLEHEGNLAGALRHLLGAAVIVPANAEVNLRLGALYRRREETENALQSYLRASECDPLSIEAHRNLFLHLVRGDGDSAQKHREFYDEYLAVMDLAAEFYLQTVDTVFVRHALPNGQMTHRGARVDPAQIHRVALLTVEGENDDISGVGQTEAAHRLCVNIPSAKKAHWLQPSVGHYGVFNGSRFRAEIVPRIADFVMSNNLSRTPVLRSALRSAVSAIAARKSNGSRAASAQNASLAPCE